MHSEEATTDRDPSFPRRGFARHDHRFSPDRILPSRLLGRVVLMIGLPLTVGLGVLAAVAPEVLLLIDRPVSAFLHDESWVPFFRVVTEVGRPWAVAVVSVVAGVLLWRSCRGFAVALPATALSAVVVDVVLKGLVDRPRPPFGVGAGADPTSFPSGHVVLGVIVLGLFGPALYLVTERRWVYRAAIGVAVVYIPVVMASRIVIGAHWFTDVVASFFIGAAFLLGTEYLVGSRLVDEHCDCRLHNRSTDDGVVGRRRSFPRRSL